MFTIYHAAAFVAVFALGLFVGYSVGHIEGKADAYDEMDGERRRTAR